MMGLSQTTGYAIHALGCLEDPACKPRLIRDIADCTGIPKPYLAKIINQLSREGIVTAKRGYRGGIFLARPPETISLLEIVEAIEGQGWISDCMLGLNDCAARGICPTQLTWDGIRAQIETALRTTTLADVIECMRESQSLVEKESAVAAAAVAPNGRSSRQSTESNPEADKQACACLASSSTRH